MGAALLLLAFNLRPVAVSVGPALAQIQADLGLGPTLAGVLTALPSLCFAVVGAIAPWLAHRIGAHRAIGVAYVLLISGQLVRAAVDGPWLFLTCSMIALSGMALANILLPSLVRLHFPNRVGLVTSLYSLSLALGLTLASAVTIPMANALGGWRAAFTAGSLVAVAAAVVWLPLLRLGRPHLHTNHSQFFVRVVARSRNAWALALFFALQSAAAYTIFGWLPSIYQAAGMSEADAGFMLAITTGAGIVPAFLLPAYVARRPQPRLMLLALSAAMAASFLGLLVAPTTLPWLWALLAAAGLSTFPLFLALLGLRADTPAGTAALSGFVQSVGYLLASVAPFVFGLLQEATGGWTWPLLMLLVLTVPMTITGLISCRDWRIETEPSVSAQVGVQHRQG
ncbi:MAG: MFS transporter [Propionibacteriaceae bacterium]|nr:MFS transporter [Propionibacteriaceae bacterium]